MQLPIIVVLLLLFLGEEAIAQGRGRQDPPVISTPRTRGNQAPPVIKEAQRQPDPDGLDLLFTEEQQSSYGFARLTPAERSRVASLITDLRSNKQQGSSSQGDAEAERAAQAVGWKPAFQWLRDNGWRKYSVSLSRNASTLVVRTDFGTYATTDLPFLFPTFMFSNGSYWCQRGLFGGIKAIIVSGRDVEFLFSTWETL